MVKRGGRAWIVATLLATLLIPAGGVIAGPQDHLDKLESKLEQVRDRIASERSRANTIEEEAEAIHRSIVELREFLDELRADITRVQAEVNSAQARIDRTQGEIDKIKGRATEQAVQLYKSGATETLDALLTAKSLTELDDKIELLGVAAQENTDALVTYGRLKVEIEAQHQELFDRQQELQGIENQRAEVLAELDQQYAEHQAKLLAIEEKLGHLHAEEGSLESAAKRVSATILEKQTLHSVAILGKSSQGFIWPLNGAINSYYGPRWGRMHTGLDIDGTTGQPIVASAAGRVILASSYSGYGNTIIIDHGGGLSTLYAHLSAYDVSNGQDVAQGEIIGRVGCTGSCTGDHLHFEVRVNGSPRDPMDYLP